jgi:hypothetical protein
MCVTFQYAALTRSHTALPGVFRSPSWPRQPLIVLPDEAGDPVFSDEKVRVAKDTAQRTMTLSLPRIFPKGKVCPDVSWRVTYVFGLKTVPRSRQVVSDSETSPSYRHG